MKKDNNMHTHQIDPYIPNEKLLEFIRHNSKTTLESILNYPFANPYIRIRDFCPLNCLKITKFSP